MNPDQIIIGADPVKQLTVFLENRLGCLHDLLSLLSKHEVHILALGVVDTTDVTMVRLIVDDPDKAIELMIKNDYAYSERRVVVTEVSYSEDIEKILHALLEAEINIHYLYSFLKRPEGRSTIALQVEDPEIAMQALHNQGIKILSQGDLSR